MKKPKSDTRIILIISAIFILLTGLIIAENLPNVTGQEEERRQALMQQAVEQSKLIALESVQEVETELESPQMDIAEAYDLLNQDILGDLSRDWDSTYLMQKIEEYEDKVNNGFEPVPYEGDIFPQELITRAEDGLYHIHSTDTMIDDYLGADDFRLDIDEMYRLFPKLDQYKDEIKTEYDAYGLTAGRNWEPGIYHFDIVASGCFGIYHLDMTSDEDYYVIAYSDGGHDMVCNVQVAKREGDDFIEVDEFEIQTGNGTVIQYKDDYYYVYLYKNGRLSGGTDGIRIHKLGTDPKKENILIRYLPETYVWQNIYVNESFDAEMHADLEEYIDSIKTKIVSDEYLEKGQEKYPKTYFGEEEQAQEFSIKNDGTYYMTDFANIEIPVYMVKYGTFPQYGWYIWAEFYLYDENRDEILELENLNLGSSWGQDTLVQLWFKEIDGKVFTFRIYHISGYEYVLNVILVEGDKITQVRNDLLVPDKSRFVLTEGEIFTNM